MNEGLKVLKRDNKKVEFNGEKIAIAIKKSFDSREDFIDKYTDEDINKVYRTVLNDIFDNYFEKAYIKVEEIQDIIEKQLLKLEYNDVYESFSNYRDKRTESRKMFLSEPKQHKLLKAIERITLKQDWIRKNNESQTDVMFNFGKTISEEFASAYFINNNFYSLHESGQIFINDLEYIPMGSIESCIIPFYKLLEKGFSIGDKIYKPANDIMSCFSLLPLIIRKSLEDMSGDVGILDFDSFLSIYVLKTFQEEFKQKIFDFLELGGFSGFIDYDSISKEINKQESIEFDISNLYKFSKNSEQIIILFNKAYNKSIISTKKIVLRELNNFLHTSYFKVGNRFRNITINLGTDISIEGRMIIEAYILSMDKDIPFKTVFKLKEGVNFNSLDPNYDLFLLSIEKLNDNMKMGYSFLDNNFNNRENEDVFYFEDGIRILDNINEEGITPMGRGVISRTYINLSRTSIKNKKEEETIQSFYKDLNHIFDLTKEQMLERFEIECNKRSNEFPFIFGESLYIDSKGIKPLEKIKKSIKNGVLAIGIVGLNECINILKIDEQQLLDFIAKKIKEIRNETKLNFMLIGPNKDVSKKFIDLDRTIYGEIKNITDKDYYDLKFDKKNIFDGGYFFELNVNDYSINDIVKLLKDYKKKEYGYLVIKKELTK